LFAARSIEAGFPTARTPTGTGCVWNEPDYINRAGFSQRSK